MTIQNVRWKRYRLVHPPPQLAHSRLRTRDNLNRFFFFSVHGTRIKHVLPIRHSCIERNVLLNGISRVRTGLRDNIVRITYDIKIHSACDSKLKVNFNPLLMQRETQLTNRICAFSHIKTTCYRECFNYYYWAGLRKNSDAIIFSRPFG